MSIYSIVLVVHILAAVCGLGAVFATPSIMKRGTTVTRTKQALDTAKEIEKYAKVGSITLLLTGLMLGVLNTSLFSEAWYITSLAVYLAIQPIVAYMIPKKVGDINEMLDKQETDELPSEFFPVAMQIGKLDNIARLSVIVLIVLMTLKPF